MLCHEFVWVFLIRRYQSQSSRMSHFHTRLPVYFKWNRYNKETNVNLCSSSVVETKTLVEKTDRNISALQSQATLRQVQHICLLALVHTEFQRSAFFWPQIWASGEDQHSSQFWQFAKTQTSLDYKSEALITAEKCIFVFFAIRVVENQKKQTYTWERRRQCNTAFSLLLKPMMQIFMHEAERNSWVIFLPCLKAYI